MVKKYVFFKVFCKQYSHMLLSWSHGDDKIKWIFGETRGMGKNICKSKRVELR